MRCTQTVEAGAYVLGALPPADRSVYERHITTCARCRDEVAELAGLPGLLGRLDADTAASIGQPAGPSEKLLEKMLADTQAERRTRRHSRRWERTVTLVAAACLALVVGGVVSALRIPAAPPPVVAAMNPVANDEPVTAMIGYWPSTRGGTEIRMTCVYADGVGSTARLGLWVYPKDGGDGRSVSWWDAGPGYRDTFYTHTDLRPDQIGRFEIREGPTVLVAYRA